MTIIGIFSGIFCNRDPYIAAIAKESGYRLVPRDEILDKAGNRSGMALAKLEAALSAKTSIFNKFTHDKERALAFIKLILAETLREDNIILLDHLVLLVPQQVAHILRVCLIADLKFRVTQAMKAQGLTERDTNRHIVREDKDVAEWLSAIQGKSDPFDASLYDILAPTDKTAPDAVAALVRDSLTRDVLLPNPASRQAVENFHLAAHVEVELIRQGHNVMVTASEGRITLTINKHVLMLSRLEEELRSIVSTVPGVQSITTKVGKDFHQSDIYRRYDFEMPSRVLLVDDEREFVQTLSERLQMRDMGSAVAYDGESALEIVSRDDPEVMILDLKMPGIDGIEVLKRVKASRPDIEVIILTGHGTEDDRTVCLELGAFAYLQKPVDIEILSETLKRANEKIRSRQS